jgi:ribosomal protein L11
MLLKNKNVTNPIVRYIKLIVPAQNATISPPIGPTLGQFGINIADFCKQFNERSKFIENDVLVLVLITLYYNKTFSFEIKMPSLGFLVNEENFFLEENMVPRYINLSSIFFILKLKNNKLFFKDVKSFFGTLRSMHIQICNDL